MGRYDFDTIIDRRHTDCVKWDGMTRTYGTNDLLALWVADMDFKAPPEVIDAIREKVEHGIYGYPVFPDGFFNSFISWVGRRHGWQIRREWIAHSPGVVTAMGLAIRAFTAPGDRILIQPPIYPPFEREIRSNGREAIHNPLILRNGHFEMDFDDLERKAEEASMMFLCSPHNPAGRVWTRNELDRVAEICLARDVILVSDEIHSDIVYSGYKHLPAASLSNGIEQRCAVFMAPSKTFNIAGLKTSVVIIPNDDLRKRFVAEQEALELNAGNIFGIAGCQAAYEHGEAWLEELLAYLEANVDFVDSFLKKRIPEIRLIRPEGTYVPFLDCRDLGLETDELQNFLIKKAGVALNSGANFGSGGECFARLNIATPRKILREGMEQIERAVRELKQGQ